jgi:hypothetical protein
MSAKGGEPERGLGPIFFGPAEYQSRKEYKNMPSISDFYGIIVKMYFVQNEHNPPHVHAIYGEYMSAVNIVTGKVLEGDLPSKALNLVLEWIGLHRDDLLRIWETQEFKKLPPLV